MRSFLSRTPPRALALALAFLAGCSDQITQPPARMTPSAAIQADKAPFKSVFVLEPLPGGTDAYSSALAINDLGQVVGESSAPGVFRAAVIWDNSTIPRALPTLAGGTYSAATAISNDGRVIAGLAHDATAGYAVRWLKSNDQWLIDKLPFSANCSVTGMSSDGTAIVAACGSLAVVWLNGSEIILGTAYPTAVNSNRQAVGTNTAGNHALLWNFSTLPPTVTDLGTLGGTYAVALNINNAGEVTGWSENANQVSHAFLWSPRKNAMTDLGAAGVTSGGYGINATGQVVGDMFPSGQHAGFFDHGKVVDLGVLPGYSGALAHSLNNNGQAVGWSYVNGSQTRATQWNLK
jgi:probable HAF family extracellular repeat protein